jgi:hypothetical protein
VDEEVYYFEQQMLKFGDHWKEGFTQAFADVNGKPFFLEVAPSNSAATYFKITKELQGKDIFAIYKTVSIPYLMAPEQVTFRGNGFISKAMASAEDFGHCDWCHFNHDTL